MKKIATTFIAACLMLSGAVYAQDGMKKDAMGKDAMHKDAMGKNGMQKDAMGK
ncbi:MAG: pentapeptide MXKDX repeat protein, partial [Telluria sp.]